MFPLTNPFVCRLPGWTAIVVAGPDAAAFLHGQFTNDVAGLGVGSTQYNGYCSPKGRLLATFPLLRTGDEAYLLVVPGEIAPGLAKRLQMFVLRAKVTVTSLAQTHECIGIGDLAPGPPEKPGVTTLALPDGRRIAVCETAAASAFRESLATGSPAAESSLWDWHSIGAGVAVITAATQDKFVPQMLNWELVGGVSFQKGCYPGQEIVARMQYLGRLKERLYRGHLADGAPAPGQPLYGALFGNQACGTIVNTAPAPSGGVDVLAVLQVASAAADTLRSAPDSEAPVLTLVPLPYAVPAPHRPA